MSRRRPERRPLLSLHLPSRAFVLCSFRSTDGQRETKPFYKSVRPLQVFIKVKFNCRSTNLPFFRVIIFRHFIRLLFLSLEPKVALHGKHKKVVVSRFPASDVDVDSLASLLRRDIEQQRWCVSSDDIIIVFELEKIISSKSVLFRAPTKRL